MKNLIKKTIVMLLVVCSLVSTVGVQPVEAHIGLPKLEIPYPKGPTKSKSLNGKKATLEGVYCNQDLLVVIFNPMTDYDAGKNVMLEVQKKYKGKYVRCADGGLLLWDKTPDDYCTFGVDHLGLKPGDNIRVRVMYYRSDNNKKKHFETKWSKWYNIKVKKNKTINKNIKCKVTKNKRGILMFQADKCDGYVVEFCKNKKFKTKYTYIPNYGFHRETDVETHIVISNSAIKQKDPVYGGRGCDGWPNLHRGMYARVTPIELFSDGQIKYYPRSKVIKL
ncbi:hypothetical protein [Roseburia sp. 1XD42-69]|uniref:hypothetical protein n=1 Tax=Roseburia sp. 1XD42-69 TaxID=2320088 RepID=UPI000EA23A5E|nr:hypothetical protein [Roseburia sp. 1XD42-69]RKJ62283.1 hypothetical protein D7Y06_17880 [Roseburia sp. 1XD42-69]